MVFAFLSLVLPAALASASVDCSLVPAFPDPLPKSSGTHGTPSGRVTLPPDGQGRIASRCYDAAGLLDGIQLVWTLQGQVVEQRVFDHGKPTGIWLSYDAPGKLRMRSVLGPSGAVTERFSPLYAPMDGVLVRGTSRDHAFLDAETYLHPSARWSGFRFDGSEAWADQTDVPHFSRVFHPVAASKTAPAGPWLVLPRALARLERFEGEPSESGWPKFENATFESRLDPATALRIVVTTAERGTTLRACLVAQGREHACQTLADRPVGIAEVAWSSEGFVRAQFDLQNDSPFGSRPVSFVWDVPRRRFVRRFGTRSEFFDGRTLVVYPMVMTAMNPGYDCSGAARTVVRCIPRPGPARLFELGRGQAELRTPPCTLKKYGDAWLCDGFNVRCDGENERLRIPTPTGIRECDATCRVLSGGVGLLVMPASEGCFAAFSGMEVTGPPSAR